MAIQTMAASGPRLASMRSWQYLEARSHPWRRQLFVKDQRLLASSVWSDMIVNELTAEEIAQNRNLPVDAVYECIQYCEENRSLLESECDQEKQWLLARGVAIEPAPAD